MTEYERGFIDGIKSKVSAELTPTLINVSRTMLEMLKPVLSTALENALNDNNAITDTDVQSVKCGKWEKKKGYLVCSNCGMAFDTIGYTYEEQEEVFRYCLCCGYRMDGDTECQ